MWESGGCFALSIAVCWLAQSLHADKERESEDVQTGWVCRQTGGVLGAGEDVETRL